MKQLNKKVGFIGAGNMAEAMINGIIKSALCKPDQIWASDVRSARLSQLEARYGINTSEKNTKVFDSVDILVLAVKPQHMDEVLDGLSKAGSPKPSPKPSRGLNLSSPLPPVSQ